MMAYMYMLECSDGSYYVGSTTSLEARLEQHQLGLGAQYTKHRLPVRLVYSAEFEKIDEAFAWEKRVQGWSRAKRQALIEDRFTDLPSLSPSRYKREADGQGPK
ncbi:MAG: GIY-YIG nuclease family protein [Promicromonosporaceae bacterium]|nr:GIY-YIG nuclease family protein [Promicromonosporaceae bacterium]